jgi:hypothetical protein
LATKKISVLFVSLCEIRFLTNFHKPLQLKKKNILIKKGRDNG